MSDQPYAHQEEEEEKEESEENIKGGEGEEGEEEEESKGKQKGKANEGESEVVVDVGAISRPTVISRGFSGAPKFSDFRKTIVSSTDTQRNSSSGYIYTSHLSMPLCPLNLTVGY